METEVTKTETWKLLWQQSLNTQHHNICMVVTHEKIKEKRSFFIDLYIFWYGMTWHQQLNGWEEHEAKRETIQHTTIIG